MSDLRTAAQMALVVLENKFLDELRDDELAAIDALRAALAAKPKPLTDEQVGAEWTPCVKLPVTVYVRQQRPGETHVSTREGITPIKPDDLIMRGVAGEEYPIGRDVFNRTYRIERDHGIGGTHG